MARTQSRRGVGLLLLAFVAGCGPRPVPVAAMEPAARPVLTKVLIANDVPDDVLLCLDLTAEQRVSDPLVHSPICLETVGHLRARMLLTRSAN